MTAATAGAQTAGNGGSVKLPDRARLTCNLHVTAGHVRVDQLPSGSVCVELGDRDVSVGVIASPDDMVAILRAALTGVEQIVAPVVTGVQHAGTVARISHSDYRRQRAMGYAGPLGTLQPDNEARYRALGADAWQLIGTVQGAALRPVVVADRPLGGGSDG